MRQPLNHKGLIQSTEDRREAAVQTLGRKKEKKEK